MNSLSSSTRIIPIETIEPTEPTKSIEPTESTELIEPIEPTELTQNVTSKADALIEKYNFNTGDILLYEHINTYTGIKDYFFNFIDTIIRCATKSKYSHVSMIIKNPPWNDELKGLYIIESSYETIPDSEDHETKLGVELIPLKYILENGENHLYFRKLHCERNAEFNEKLCTAHSVVHNRPYDTSIIDWLKAWWNIKKGNVQKKKTFWCSALVSYLYCSLGFLDKKLPWTIISPKQLGTESNNKNALTFINCQLDKEIKIE